MTEIDALFQLQGIDLEIDEKSRRLDEIKAALGLSDAVRSARRTVETARARLAELEAQQRQLEWEVDDRGTKIRELDAKLYSGTIKNPKELSGLQTEVDHLREALGKVEERALDVIDQADAARAQLRNDTAALTAAEAAWREEQSALRDEQAALQTSVGALTTRRQSVVGEIPAPLVVKYDELRRQRRGVAVARIDRNTCLGCRTTLATSEVQAARLGKIATCSSCGRMLYAGR